MPGKRLRAASWSGLFGAVLVAGMLTGGTAAQASTTWIVDNTNPNCIDSGANAAHPAQPFCKIADANTKVQQGDTVLVNAERITRPRASTRPFPVFRAARSPTANQGVTISGGKSFALSGNKSYITINGFTITGTSSAGISVSGGSNVTISNNTESYAGTPISSPAAGISLTNLAGGLVRGQHHPRQLRPRHLPDRVPRPA